MTAEEVTRLLPSLIAQISESYPEVRGARSTVEQKRSEISPEALRKLNIPNPPSPQTRFVVTFRNEMTAQNGTPLFSIVRATLDGEGRLLRVTSSKQSPNK